MTNPKRDMNSDLLKLANAFYKNIAYNEYIEYHFDGCEYGSVGTDYKRPFGSYNVTSDILEIIGCEGEADSGEYTDEQEGYANALYQKHLIPYLKKIWRQHTKLLKEKK